MTELDPHAPEESLRFVYTLADELVLKERSMAQVLDRLISESTEDRYRQFYTDMKDAVMKGGSLFSCLEQNPAYETLLLTSVIMDIRGGEKDGSLTERLPQMLKILRETLNT